MAWGRPRGAIGCLGEKRVFLWRKERSEEAVAAVGRRDGKELKVCVKRRRKDFWGRDRGVPALG